MSKPDLSFVTTEDILDELEDRHYAFVFIGLPNTGQVHGSGNWMTVDWRGGVYTCLGMMETVSHQMKLDGRPHPNPPEDL